MTLVAMAGYVVAQTSTDPDFTIIVLPDTQYYSATYPQIFTSQTNWIAANKSALNIQAVIGVGDIVNGGGSLTQWQNADTSVKVLEGKIPYFLPIGNHDYNANDPQNRTSSATNFNKYFGPARYRNSYSGWQGSYPSGSNENFYSTLSINGKPYLIMALEFYPRKAAVDWAAGVIAANPDKEVILTMHAYEYFDDTRVALCDKYNAEYYGMGADYDGEDLFYGLVKKYKNISLVLSGHIVTGVTGAAAAGHRSDMGAGGNLVNQIMANYQNYTNGGNGFLRIMKFRPSLNRIEVTTYSPYTGGYMTDAANQFTVPWHADGTFMGTGAITGTVKKASDCTVVSGASVSYSGGTTTSSSNGKFAMSGISPSNYTFTAQASGFATNAKTIQIDPTLSASWKIFMGSTTNAGTITGVVTNNGSPVSGATVYYDGAGTNTTSNGTYTLTNVPAGTVQVTASAAGLNSSSATVTVTSGVQVTQNFALTSTVTTGTVTGKVTDVVTGAAIAGASVVSGTQSTNSAADGTYSLSNVPAGNAQVNASAGGYASASATVAVTSGQTSTRDFQLTAVQPGAITGQVTSAKDGSPLAGAQVAYNNSTGVTTTDANGNYLLSAVAAGTYTVTTTAAGFLSASAQVTVSSGVTATQAFTLNPTPPTGTIAGWVKDSAGNAIAGAQVSSGSATATTDSSGSYALPGVGAGQGVQVTASAKGYDPSTLTTNVAEGATSEVDFSLLATQVSSTPPPATTGGVTGKVTNLSTGGALSGATVTYSGGSTTTNTSGVYTLSAVTAGTYAFTVSKSGYLTRTGNVTVTAGTTTTSNFQLSTAGKISGTVKNGSGTAISGATLLIQGGNIATTVSLTTSSTGTYTTAYIPIGSYTVKVSKSGYTTQTKSATVSSGATTTVSFTMQ